MLSFFMKSGISDVEWTFYDFPDVLVQLSREVNGHKI